MSAIPDHRLGGQPAGTARKKLIIIMGVQRSGTTALFEALAGAAGVSARHESAGDEIYDDYYLRPEPEIRGFLQSLPGTVLLKPVRESERRTPSQVAAEYRDYDLRIVWLYRDPVNVYHSYVRLGWSSDLPEAASWFAAQWARRNMEALADRGSLQKQLVFVSYEDLTANRYLTGALADELGIQSSTFLRPDSSGGRKALPTSIQEIVDNKTVLVRSALAHARSIQPHRKLPAIADFFDKTRKRLTALVGKKSSPASPATIFSSAEYADFLSATDLGPLYREWRKAGALRRSADTGNHVAIGYEACRLVYENSFPFGSEESIAWHTSERMEQLETFLAERRPELRRQVEGEIAATFSPATSFDVSSSLARLSDRLAALWLGLPENEFEACVRALGKMSLPGASDFAQEWETIRPAIERSGLISGLLDAGLIEREEVAGFFRATCLPLTALNLIVLNSLVALSGRSALMERLRADPRVVRSALDESQRLNPIFLSMKRRLVRSIEVGGAVLPGNSEVDLLVGAANRDPEVFADADEFDLGRNAPPPFLLESQGVPFMRLQDEVRPGCNHLVFDAASMAIGRLLADPRSLRVESGSRAVFQLSGGSCIQGFLAARVALIPA